MNDAIIFSVIICVMKHSIKSDSAGFHAWGMKSLAAGAVSAAFVLMSSFPAAAQDKGAADADVIVGEDPAGTLTYSLPATSIAVTAEAVCEQFFAGPYASYASKYLGLDVRQKDAVTYTLSSVSLTPYTEADQTARYIFNSRGRDAEAALLRLTDEGLVAFADEGSGNGAEWRFPLPARADFNGKGLTTNLASEATTLYRTSKGKSAFDKVSVRQNMVVEKSLEKRAAEAAAIIFDIREKRLQIVTGDTDATYSGEAMGAAVAELTRLEQEYLLLFTGYSECRTQKMSFEVIPQKDRSSQMYVAFRISDSEGLLPADNLSGRPVVMEIVPQEVPSVPVDKKTAKGTKALSLTYRIPAPCTVKLLDGMDVVMQTRMLIYQLGRESTLPVNITVM